MFYSDLNNQLPRSGFKNRVTVGMPDIALGGSLCTPHDATTFRRENKAVVQEEHTLVIDTATGDAVYTLRVNGIDISYTAASGSPTKASIRNGIRTAIRETISVDSFESIDDLSTDGLTFVSRVDDTNALEVRLGAMTLTKTVDKSSGYTLRYGQFYCREAASGDISLPALTAGAAKVVHVTYSSAVNSVVYQLLITVDGVVYQPNYTADGSATLTEIYAGLASAVNAAMPENSVLAAADGATKLVLTSEVEGQDFTVVALCFGAATGTVTISTANLAPALAVPLEGMVVASGDHLNSKVLPLQQFSGCIRGKVLLKLENTYSTAGDPLYLRVEAGTLSDQIAGNLRFDSDSGKAVLLSSVTSLPVALDWAVGPNSNSVWEARIG